MRRRSLRQTRRSRICRTQKAVCEALSEQRRETNSALCEQFARAVVSDTDKTEVVLALSALPAWPAWPPGAYHGGGTPGVLAAGEAIDTKRLEEGDVNLKKVKHESAIWLRVIEGLRSSLATVRQEVNVSHTELELKKTFIEGAARVPRLIAKRGMWLVPSYTPYRWR